MATQSSGYNFRYRAPARGGATIAGNWATPGYVSPFVQGGGVRSDIANSGTAANAAFRGVSSPTGGGITRSFGGIGPSGPRIDARAQLSPNTGRGLADFYAGQVMPSEWDRLQNRALQQQDWLSQQNFPQRIADNRARAQANSANAFSGGSTSFGGMRSGGSFPASPNAFTSINTFQDQIQWRKDGGPTKKIQPYIVNEEGVEAYQPKGGDPMLIPGPMQLFIPPKDGKIINHRDTMKMMGNHSGTKPPQARQNGGMVSGSYFRSGGWKPASANSSGALGIMDSPRSIGRGSMNPYVGGFLGQSLQNNMMNGIIPNPGNRMMRPFGLPGAGTSVTMEPLQFRARGGRVQAPQMSNAFPYEPRNPWAAKWAMRQQQAPSFAGGGAFGNSYEDLYQQGVSAGIDMTNAPESASALRRYLNLGRRDQSAVASGRAAAQQSLARSAQEAIPRAQDFNPIEMYGTGSVQFTPQPSLFANEQGQFFPWSDPYVPGQSVEDMSVTWMQDRAFSQNDRNRQRFNRRAPRSPTFQEAEFTLEDYLQ